MLIMQFSYYNKIDYLLDNHISDPASVQELHNNSASVVIGQELSLDNNIELLQSPSLSVNFQATCTKIELLQFLALCFLFLIHLLQPINVLCT